LGHFRKRRLILDSRTTFYCGQDRKKMGDGRGTIAHLSEASYSCRLTYSCRLKKQIEAKAKAKPNAVNASSRIPIGLTLACAKIEVKL